MGTAILVVELVDGIDEFRRIIERSQPAGELTQNDDVFEFPFQGDSSAASDLLAALVSAGVRVASFSRKRESLEDLFLQVGVKDLS